MILEMKSSSQFHAALVPFPYTLLTFLFFFFNGGSGTTFTIVNDCNFTVWPGISAIKTITDIGFNITGFELTNGTSRSFQASDKWSETTIWGRTGCTFNESGLGSCATGDCGTNEMECYNGVTPPSVTTLVQFNTYHKGSSPEYHYAINIATGYNLQILVEATGGTGSCAKIGCIDDLNQRCPSQLKLEGGGGCKSACQAFGSPDECCPSGICKPTAYGQLFKSACPGSVVYMDEDMTTPYTCTGANYSVKFCPPTTAFSPIKLGRQLKSTDQLLSIGGEFTLGFFGDGYRYLGIWYTNDVQSTKVWVANPNSPIVSPSGTHALSIDPNTGNLIINAGGKTLMNITNIQVGPNANLSATLTYQGNFLLINEIDKSNLWQSFDHPTNVLLPGMKLGSNIRTGRNWTLTSCLSNEIPHSGAFTLSWEPIDGLYYGLFDGLLMIRQRGQPYWTSGNRFNQTFPYIFALNGPKSQSHYDLSFEERYLLLGGSYDLASFPMWILTPNGQIKDGDNSIVWTPEFCYGYNSSDGCVESDLPQCRREGDEFSEKKGEFALDTTTRKFVDNSSLSIGDCFIKCWNDCQCVGFYSNANNGTGCVIWTGSNTFLVNQHDNSTLKYVINQNPRTGNKNMNRIWIWILISVAIPLVFLCLWLLWYIKKRKQDNERRKRDGYFLELTASESFKDVHQLEGNGGSGNDLLLFSFVSVMAATDDFSVENKLGQGGFGPVYKVMLLSS